MPCSISCTLSFIFIVSMIYMNNATTKSQTIQNYEKQLPEDLKNIYKKIVGERLSIYYYGYILGFILSLIIIIYNYQNKSIVLGKILKVNYNNLSQEMTMRQFSKTKFLS